MLLSVLLRQEQGLNHTKNQEIKGHLNSWSNTEVRKLDQNVARRSECSSWDQKRNFRSTLQKLHFRSTPSEAPLQEHSSEASLQKHSFRSTFRSFTSEALLQKHSFRSTTSEALHVCLTPYWSFNYVIFGYVLTLYLWYRLLFLCFSSDVFFWD